jgi:hypothetical protein
MKSDISGAARTEHRKARSFPAKREGVVVQRPVKAKPMFRTVSSRSFAGAAIPYQKLISRRSGKA